MGALMNAAPPLSQDYIPPLSPLNFSIYDIIGIVLAIVLLTYALVFVIVHLAISICSALHDWTNSGGKSKSQPAVQQSVPVVQGTIISSSAVGSASAVVAVAATSATSHTPISTSPYRVLVRLVEVYICSYLLRATVLRASDKPTTRADDVWVDFKHNVSRADLSDVLHAHACRFAPVVIRGGVAHWAAVDKWTAGYLGEHMGPLAPITLSENRPGVVEEIPETIHTHFHSFAHWLMAHPTKEKVAEYKAQVLTSTY
jgi:hypothetical protein